MDNKINTLSMSMQNRCKALRRGKDNNFCWRRWGSSLPGLRKLDPRIFLAQVFAKLPSNIFPNPSEVIVN